MKLLKNVLESINYGIGEQNPHKGPFEWNKLPGGLFDDNRMKIVTKPIFENKAQMLESGDKMRIPGVLDYTGAKYPFKKIKKGQDGLIVDNNIYNGGNITFTPNIYKPKAVTTISTGENGELVVSAPSISKGNGKFMRRIIPDDNARYQFYRTIDPKFSVYKKIDPNDPNSKSRRNYNDTMNNRIQKFISLYKLSGNPNIHTRKNWKDKFIKGNRAYNTGNNIYLRGNNTENMEDLLSELPHSFQRSKLAEELNLDSSFIKTIGGDIKDSLGFDGYNRPSSGEFIHKVEGAFRDFVFNPKYKTTEDFKRLINEYKTKALSEYNKQKKKRMKEIANNVPLFFHKSGSKIHIKKKNRGKFTDYCGGNVTQDCINRAKRSGNKTLVKRAVFAENVRHFKRRSGGLIVQESKLNNIINN